LLYASWASLNTVDSCFFLPTLGNGINATNAGALMVKNCTFFNNATAITTNSMWKCSNNIFTDCGIPINNTQTSPVILSRNYYRNNTSPNNFATEYIETNAIITSGPPSNDYVNYGINDLRLVPTSLVRGAALDGGDLGAIQRLEGTYPAITDVRSGTTYDVGGQEGPLTGTCAVPADVRHGVNVAQTTGLAYIPLASDVKVGIPTDQTVGTFENGGGAFGVLANQNITFDITTFRFSTGVSNDCDSLPTGILVRNGADLGTSVGIFHKATGLYTVSFTIPEGVSQGDLMQCRISAVVDTVPGLAIVWDSQVSSNDLNLVKAAVYDSQQFDSADKTITFNNGVQQVYSDTGVETVEP
jgi:hypothetical protein